MGRQSGGSQEAVEHRTILRHGRAGRVVRRASLGRKGPIRTHCSSVRSTGMSAAGRVIRARMVQSRSGSWRDPQFGRQIGVFRYLSISYAASAIIRTACRLTAPLMSRRACRAIERKVRFERSIASL